MPARIARFTGNSGLFIVQVNPDPQCVISMIEAPDFWGPGYEEWLHKEGFWTPHDMEYYWPEFVGTHRLIFTFKDKVYVKLGLSASGFQRVRWIGKLYSPVHDDVDGGEDEEDESDS